MTLATRRVGTVFSCPGTGIVGWLYSSSISSPAPHDTHLLRNSMEPFQGVRKHTLTAQGFSREQAHSPFPVGHRTALRSAAGRHSQEPCAKLINSAQPQPIFKTHTDLQPTFKRGRGQRALHHIGACNVEAQHLDIKPVKTCSPPSSGAVVSAPSTTSALVKL